MPLPGITSPVSMSIAPPSPDRCELLKQAIPAMTTAVVTEAITVSIARRMTVSYSLASRYQTQLEWSGHNSQRGANAYTTPVHACAGAKMRSAYGAPALGRYEPASNPRGRGSRSVALAKALESRKALAS